MNPASSVSTLPAAPSAATPAASSSSGSSVVHSLSRLEHDSLALASQFGDMVASLQQTHGQLADLTLEYMRSMDASVRSSSAAVDILIDTHTSLIRKLLIAVQQTSGIDALEKQVAQTKLALSEIERGVEALLAEDALNSARLQLQQELDPHLSTPSHPSAPNGMDAGDRQMLTVVRGPTDLEAQDLAAEQIGTALTPMRIVSSPPSRKGTPGPTEQTNGPTTSNQTRQQATLPPPSFDEPIASSSVPVSTRPKAQLPELKALEPL